MSTMSSVPDFKAGLKSFWQKPEGKTGMLVIAGAIAAVVFVWGQAIVEWAIGFTMDLLHLAIVGGSLFLVVAILLNKDFRSGISNLFQSTMRWFTGWVVEIDPIGVLQNTVDRMKDNNEKLGKAVAGCNGAKVGIQQAMGVNSDAITHATSLKDQADKQARTETNPLRLQRFQLDKTKELQEIGRRMKSNEKLNKILDQTVKMYNMLIRYQNLAEFNIDNTQAEVDNARQERKAILVAYKGLGFAQRIIKGDPEQLKMMNASLEFLAEDNANKLGAMEDFARYSEKYLTQMDLEQGASADDAEKMLNKYEKQLLSAGSTETVSSQMPRSSDAVPVARGSKPLDGDYL